MRRTFREKTSAAYGYALVDSVSTLLVHERMQAEDRRVYKSFEFAEVETPPMRATLGGRVADFIVRATHRLASGSAALAGIGKVRELMRRGGAGLFERDPRASRYGGQTGLVHGGLLVSRTSTRFWHEAPGQFRDVDMEMCYGRAIHGMNVYWGRPLIIEPGEAMIGLRDAAEFAMRHADPDGWMIRVTGPIGAAANALIPSTEGAITSRNYRSRRRGRGARPRRDGDGTSRLYSRVVESGIITYATWVVIRALPVELRRDYERLTADAIILYPRTLAARDGAEYDEIVARVGEVALPWRSEVDLDGLRLVTTEAIDAAHVSLRFPIGEIAGKLMRLRRKAQQAGGKGSGRELAWKRHVNTAYGVLGGRFHDTNNFVAANVITARVRAEAFAMSMALNSHQTITDGCTYRRDQIPAVPLAECLRISPDYPIRRAEEGSGIPFVDPATIPSDEAGFREWYPGHVARHFAIDDADFRELIATHILAHKPIESTGSFAFDAMVTDGASNYVKLTRSEDGGWKAEEFKARGFGKGAKPAVLDWLLATCRSDDLTELAPIAEDVVLLKYAQAGRKARAALDAGFPTVVFPLAHEFAEVKVYRLLKMSAFVFNDPDQRRAVVGQVRKFEEENGCGLEGLALRRSYGGRRKGSVADVAEEVHRLIRSGARDLAKPLNLARWGRDFAAVAAGRRGMIAYRKEEARRSLIERIDVQDDADDFPTGLIVTDEDRRWIDPVG
jgi:hypothetical protein